MRDITKTFPGVVALDNVSFDLKAGEIHALIGENGAGKSTLIKVISGAHQADSGEVVLDGSTVNIRDPHHAQELGIYTIYQEVTYIPDMSIAENMFLGQEIVSGGLIKPKKQIEQTERLFEEFGYCLNPRQMARDLNIAELRMISIIKALNNEVKILILDEPTASLTDHEKEILFANLRRLQEKGVGIIYISHHLEELKGIADRVTVFRNGMLIETLEMDQVNTIDDLVPLMIGKEVGNKYPKQKAQVGETILRVKGLSRKRHFHNVNLELKSGEVLGFFGLVGCGFEEVFRSVFGASGYDEGSVEVLSDGQVQMVQKNRPKHALDLSISYIPRDRKHEGLIMPLSVRENIVMASYHKFAGRFTGLINRRRVKETAELYRQKMRIKTPRMHTKVETLSGGNQQKVVMAKALCRSGKVFLFNEPTAGIDVGSKVEIYQFINQLTAAGAGVVMVSYELPEIMGMSDRIVVMYQGSVVKEFSRDEATEDEILKYAFGHGRGAEADTAHSCERLA